MDDETTLYPDSGHPYLLGKDSAVPSLKVLSGGLKGKEYLLSNQEYNIGRDQSSDIVIPESVVSRRHALIKRKFSEYVICDTQSTNGVYVNNLKMEKAVLNHGDTFQIGSCVFQFVWKRKL